MEKEEYYYWNVRFQRKDGKRFYEYMNILQPGRFNVRPDYVFSGDNFETTMVLLTESQALSMKLATPFKVERL